MSRLSSNPYRRGFKVEEFIDRGATKKARRARDVELETRGRDLIRAALDGCDPALREDLALVLIEEATVAAGHFHDAETIQAWLGRLAHQNGAAITAPPKPIGQANALFRRDAA
ncbi:hypothetical protein [Phenylobacterium sp.]|uniref:hypothetical protein n=1 Tax=Phenylobacterium sp. TaxID=1871053 RepID=UPI002730FA05|nr:hypothetical protein [Phenylobacterium sp.]MDP1598997.1 hypothetical protein [Phenylobacterium sp.]MDP3590425.1 hypothetical protein [Phenylobacterium sp.]